MGFVFNPENAKIVIANLSTERGKGLQEGVMLLSIGAMKFWHNYFTHGE